MELKRAINQEVFEKEASQNSATDLRNMVRRVEGEKSDLQHTIQETKQALSGWFRRLTMVCFN